MIINHAAQLDVSLTLWGEDSDPPPTERLSDVHHPRFVSALRLSEAVGIPPEDTVREEVGATVWLPSCVVTDSTVRTLCDADGLGTPGYSIRC